jgi:hypothetical protein
MANESRLNIDVIGDNQADADLAARLVAATFNQNGFDDVTIVGHAHVDTDEEVVAAMQNLSPSIFQAEVVIEASVFEESNAMAAEGGDEGPGNPFPDPDEGEDEVETTYE